MSKEALDKLAAEASSGPTANSGDAAGDASADNASAGDAAAPDAMRQPHPGVVEIFTGLAAMVGGELCDRAGVTPLSDAEAKMLGQSGATVAAQYDLAMDPRTAAWLAFATVVIGVTLPRYRELRMRRAAPAPEAPRAAPAETGDVSSSADVAQPNGQSRAAEKPAPAKGTASKARGRARKS